MKRLAIDFKLKLIGAGYQPSKLLAREFKSRLLRNAQFFIVNMRAQVQHVRTYHREP